MKSKKVWLDNLKNGIITNEMLSLCLYSVNKRAKNYRDMESKYRNSNDYYHNEERYRDKKNYMYELKNKMLEYLKPKCIYYIKSISKVRVRNDEDGYYNIKKEDVIRKGFFIDRDTKEEVEFKDVYAEDYEYYKYYQVDDFGFHIPIDDFEADEKLEIIEIQDLTTFGKDINDLVSMQFVKKTLETLKASNKIMAN